MSEKREFATSSGRIEDYYEIGKELGKGSFSVVYEAKELSTGQLYAVKRIKRKFIKKKLLQREIDIMKNLRHPNILFCKEVFETEQFISIVLELVRGGELYDKIVDEGEFSDEEARPIVLQVVSAIEYLHKNGIAHRDLKPENLLCVVKGDGKRPRQEKIKVADFGLSKMFIEEDLTSQCGSPTYVAPEVLLCQTYTNAVDMWALGVITFVMLTGCFPFFEEGNNYSALYQKIIAVDYTFPEEPAISEDAKNFIRSLLVFDPAKRMTSEESKAHPWLKGTTLPSM